MSDSFSPIRPIHFFGSARTDPGSGTQRSQSEVDPSSRRSDSAQLGGSSALPMMTYGDPAAGSAQLGGSSALPMTTYGDPAASSAQLGGSSALPMTTYGDAAAGSAQLGSRSAFPTTTFGDPAAGSAQGGGRTVLPSCGDITNRSRSEQFPGVPPNAQFQPQLHTGQFSAQPQLHPHAQPHPQLHFDQHLAQQQVHPNTQPQPQMHVDQHLTQQQMHPNAQPQPQLHIDQLLAQRQQQAPNLQQHLQQLQFQRQFQPQAQQPLQHQHQPLQHQPFFPQTQQPGFGTQFGAGPQLQGLDQYPTVLQQHQQVGPQPQHFRIDDDKLSNEPMLSAPSSILAPASAVDRHSVEAIERMVAELKQTVFGEIRQTVLRVADLEQNEIAMVQRSKDVVAKIDECRGEFRDKCGTLADEFRDKCGTLAERCATAVNSAESDIRGKLATVDVRLTNALNSCILRIAELERGKSPVEQQGPPPDTEAGKAAVETARLVEDIIRSLDAERKDRAADNVDQRAAVDRIESCLAEVKVDNDNRDKRLEDLELTHKNRADELSTAITKCSNGLHDKVSKVSDRLAKVSDESALSAAAADSALRAATTNAANVDSALRTATKATETALLAKARADTAEGALLKLQAETMTTKLLNPEPPETTSTDEGSHPLVSAAEAAHSTTSASLEDLARVASQLENKLGDDFRSRLADLEAKLEAENETWRTVACDAQLAANGVQSEVEEAKNRTALLVFDVDGIGERLDFVETALDELADATAVQYETPDVQEATVSAGGAAKERSQTSGLPSSSPLVAGPGEHDAVDERATCFRPRPSPSCPDSVNNDGAVDTRLQSVGLPTSPPSGAVDVRLQSGGLPMSPPLVRTGPSCTTSAVQGGLLRDDRPQRGWSTASATSSSSSMQDSSVFDGILHPIDRTVGNEELFAKAEAFAVATKDLHFQVGPTGESEESATTRYHIDFGDASFAPVQGEVGGQFVKGIATRLVVNAPFDGTNKVDIYHKARKALTHAVEKVPSGIIIQPGSVVLEAWWKVRSADEADQRLDPIGAQKSRYKVQDFPKPAEFLPSPDGREFFSFSAETKFAELRAIESWFAAVKTEPHAWGNLLSFLKPGTTVARIYADPSLEQRTAFPGEVGTDAGRVLISELVSRIKSAVGLTRDSVRRSEIDGLLLPIRVSAKSMKIFAPDVLAAKVFIESNFLRKAAAAGYGDTLDTTIGAALVANRVYDHFAEMEVLGPMLAKRWHNKDRLAPRESRTLGMLCEELAAVAEVLKETGDSIGDKEAEAAAPAKKIDPSAPLGGTTGGGGNLPEAAKTNLTLRRDEQALKPREHECGSLCHDRGLHEKVMTNIVLAALAGFAIKEDLECQKCTAAEGVETMHPSPPPALAADPAIDFCITNLQSVPGFDGPRRAAYCRSPGLGGSVRKVTDILLKDEVFADWGAEWGKKAQEAQKAGTLSKLELVSDREKLAKTRALREGRTWNDTRPSKGNGKSSWSGGRSSWNGGGGGWRNSGGGGNWRNSGGGGQKGFGGKGEQPVRGNLRSNTTICPLRHHPANDGGSSAAPPRQATTEYRYVVAKVPAGSNGHSDEWPSIVRDHFTTSRHLTGTLTDAERDDLVESCVKYANVLWRARSAHAAGAHVQTGPGAHAAGAVEMRWVGPHEEELLKEIFHAAEQPAPASPDDASPDAGVVPDYSVVHDEWLLNTAEIQNGTTSVVGAAEPRFDDVREPDSDEEAAAGSRGERTDSLDQPTTRTYGPGWGSITASSAPSVNNTTSNPAYYHAPPPVRITEAGVSGSDLQGQQPRERTIPDGQQSRRRTTSGSEQALLHRTNAAIPDDGTLEPSVERKAKGFTGLGLVWFQLESKQGGARCTSFGNNSHTLDVEGTDALMRWHQRFRVPSFPLQFAVFYRMPPGKWSSFHNYQVEIVTVDELGDMQRTIEGVTTERIGTYWSFANALDEALAHHDSVSEGKVTKHHFHFAVAGPARSFPTPGVTTTDVAAAFNNAPLEGRTTPHRRTRPTIAANRGPTPNRRRPTVVQTDAAQSGANVRRLNTITRTGDSAETGTGTTGAAGAAAEAPTPPQPPGENADSERYRSYLEGKLTDREERQWITDYEETLKRGASAPKEGAKAAPVQPTGASTTQTSNRTYDKPSWATSFPNGFQSWRAHVEKEERELEQQWMRDYEDRTLRSSGLSDDDDSRSKSEDGQAIPEPGRPEGAAGAGASSSKRSCPPLLLTKRSLAPPASAAAGLEQLLDAASAEPLSPPQGADAKGSTEPDHPTPADSLPPLQRAGAKGSSGANRATPASAASSALPEGTVAEDDPDLPTHAGRPRAASSRSVLSTSSSESRPGVLRKKKPAKAPKAYGRTEITLPKDHERLKKQEVTKRANQRGLKPPPQPVRHGGGQQPSRCLESPADREEQRRQRSRQRATTVGASSRRDTDFRYSRNDYRKTDDYRQQSQGKSRQDSRRGRQRNREGSTKAERGRTDGQREQPSARKHDQHAAQRERSRERKAQERRNADVPTSRGGAPSSVAQPQIRGQRQPTSDPAGSGGQIQQRGPKTKAQREMIERAAPILADTIVRAGKPRDGAEAVANRWKARKVTDGFRNQGQPEKEARESIADAKRVAPNFCDDDLWETFWASWVDLSTHGTGGITTAQRQADGAATGVSSTANCSRPPAPAGPRPDQKSDVATSSKASQSVPPTKARSNAVGDTLSTRALGKRLPTPVPEPVKRPQLPKRPANVLERDGVDAESLRQIRDIESKQRRLEQQKAALIAGQPVQDKADTVAARPPSVKAELTGPKLTHAKADLVAARTQSVKADLVATKAPSIKAVLKTANEINEERTAKTPATKVVLKSAKEVEAERTAQARAEAAPEELPAAEDPPPVPKAAAPQPAAAAPQGGAPAPQGGAAPLTPAEEAVVAQERLDKAHQALADVSNPTSRRGKKLANKAEAAIAAAENELITKRQILRAVEEQRKAAMGGGAASSRPAMGAICPAEAVTSLNAEDGERVNARLQKDELLEKVTKLAAAVDENFGTNVTPMWLVKQVHPEDEAVWELFAGDVVSFEQVDLVRQKLASRVVQSAADSAVADADSSSVPTLAKLSQVKRALVKVWVRFLDTEGREFVPTATASLKPEASDSKAVVCLDSGQGVDARDQICVQRAWIDELGFSHLVRKTGKTVAVAEGTSGKSYAGEYVTLAYGLENADGVRSLMRIVNAFVVSGLGDLINAGLETFITDKLFFLGSGQLATIGSSLFPPDRCNGAKHLDPTDVLFPIADQVAVMPSGASGSTAALRKIAVDAKPVVTLDPGVTRSVDIGGEIAKLVSESPEQTEFLIETAPGVTSPDFPRVISRSAIETSDSSVWKVRVRSEEGRVFRKSDLVRIHGRKSRLRNPAAAIAAASVISVVNDIGLVSNMTISAGLERIVASSTPISAARDSELGRVEIPKAAASAEGGVTHGTWAEAADAVVNAIQITENAATHDAHDADTERTALDEDCVWDRSPWTPRQWPQSGWNHDVWTKNEPGIGDRRRSDAKPNAPNVAGPAPVAEICTEPTAAISSNRFVPLAEDVRQQEETDTPEPALTAAANSPRTAIPERHQGPDDGYWQSLQTLSGYGHGAQHYVPTYGLTDVADLSWDDSEPRHPKRQEKRRWARADTVKEMLSVQADLPYAALGPALKAAERKLGEGATDDALTIQLGLSVEGNGRELFVDLLAERIAADKFDEVHGGPDAAHNAYTLPTDLTEEGPADGYLLTSKYVAAGKRSMTQEEIRKGWDIVAADCADRARNLPDPENLLDPHSAEWANIVRGYFMEDRHLSDALSDDEHLELVELCVKYAHIFYGPARAFPECAWEKLRQPAKTEAARSWRVVPAFPTSPLDRVRWEYLVREAVVTGKAERYDPEKHGPLAVTSPAFLVKHGTKPCKRIAVDYRAYNRGVEELAMNMPTAGECLAAVPPGSDVYGTLDAAFGFAQLELETETGVDLAMATPLGILIPTRLPLGPKWGPSAFQARTSATFTKAIPFVDDLSLGDKGWPNFRDRLAHTFAEAAEKGISFGLQKTIVGAQEVKILGKLRGRKGLGVPRDKAAQLTDWVIGEGSALFSATQFANFLRDFCPSFPEVASQLSPLTGLKRDAFKRELDRNEKEVAAKREAGQKEANTEQDGAQTFLRKVPLKSYKELIEELEAALTDKAYFVELDIEAALDWRSSGRPLVAMVDASDVGRAQLWAQAGEKGGPLLPVRCTAKCWSKAEKKTTAFEKELVAGKEAIDTYVLLYAGLEFFLLTDHRNLTDDRVSTLITNAIKRRKIKRWVAQLAETELALSPLIHRLWLSGANNPSDPPSRIFSTDEGMGDDEGPGSTEFWHVMCDGCRSTMDLMKKLLVAPKLNGADEKTDAHQELDHPAEPAGEVEAATDAVDDYTRAMNTLVPLRAPDEEKRMVHLAPRHHVDNPAKGKFGKSIVLSGSVDGEPAWSQNGERWVTWTSPAGKKRSSFEDAWGRAQLATDGILPSRVIEGHTEGVTKVWTSYSVHTECPDAEIQNRSGSLGFTQFNSWDPAKCTRRPPGEVCAKAIIEGTDVIGGTRARCGCQAGKPPSGTPTKSTAETTAKLTAKAKRAASSKDSLLTTPAAPGKGVSAAAPKVGEGRATDSPLAADKKATAASAKKNASARIPAAAAAKTKGVAAAPAKTTKTAPATRNQGATPSAVEPKQGATPSSAGPKQGATDVPLERNQGATSAATGRARSERAAPADHRPPATTESGQDTTATSADGKLNPKTDAKLDESPARTDVSPAQKSRIPLPAIINNCGEIGNSEIRKSKVSTVGASGIESRPELEPLEKWARPAPPAQSSRNRSDPAPAYGGPNHAVDSRGTGENLLSDHVHHKAGSSNSSQGAPLLPGRLSDPRTESIADDAPRSHIPLPALLTPDSLTVNVESSAAARAELGKVDPVAGPDGRAGAQTLTTKAKPPFRPILPAISEGNETDLLPNDGADCPVAPPPCASKPEQYIGYPSQSDAPSAALPSSTGSGIGDGLVRNGAGGVRNSDGGVRHRNGDSGVSIRIGDNGGARIGDDGGSSGVLPAPAPDKIRIDDPVSVHPESVQDGPSPEIFSVDSAETDTPDDKAVPQFAHRGALALPFSDGLSGDALARYRWSLLEFTAPGAPKTPSVVLPEGEPAEALRELYVAEVGQSPDLMFVGGVTGALPIIPRMRAMYTDGVRVGISNLDQFRAAAEISPGVYDLQPNHPVDRVVFMGMMPKQRSWLDALKLAPTTKKRITEGQKTDPETALRRYIAAENEKTGRPDGPRPKIFSAEERAETIHSDDFQSAVAKRFSTTVGEVRWAVIDVVENAYRIEDGMLAIAVGSTRAIVMPDAPASVNADGSTQSMRDEMLETIHGEVYGHPSAYATMILCRRAGADWPTIRTDCENFIRRCWYCRYSAAAPTRMIAQTMQARRRGQMYVFDHAGEYFNGKLKECRYVFGIVDQGTLFCWLFWTSTKSVDEAAKYLNLVATIALVPEIWKSDNGFSSFDEKARSKLKDWMRINFPESTYKSSTSDHAPGQGSVENLWKLVTKGINCPPVPKTIRQAQDRLQKVQRDLRAKPIRARCGRSPNQMWGIADVIPPNFGILDDSQYAAESLARAVDEAETHELRNGAHFASEKARAAKRGSTTTPPCVEGDLLRVVGWSLRKSHKGVNVEERVFVARKPLQRAIYVEKIDGSEPPFRNPVSADNVRPLGVNERSFIRTFSGKDARGFYLPDAPDKFWQLESYDLLRDRFHATAPASGETLTGKWSETAARCLPAADPAKRVWRTIPGPSRKHRPVKIARMFTPSQNPLSPKDLLRTGMRSRRKLRCKSVRVKRRHIVEVYSREC